MSHFIYILQSDASTFTISSNTIMAHVDSSFYKALINGENVSRIINSNNVYYVDADSVSMGLMVSYMRGYLFDPSNLEYDTLVKLRADAKYFNLTGLLDIIEANLDESNYITEPAICTSYEPEPINLSDIIRENQNASPERTLNTSIEEILGDDYDIIKSLVHRLQSGETEIIMDDGNPLVDFEDDELEMPEPDIIQRLSNNPEVLELIKQQQRDYDNLSEESDDSFDGEIELLSDEEKDD